ncbi:hypothetical protein CPB85DRAFT_1220096 [Mucidula mucida]|nr:hypothetical protein CPB85DRAFT_1443715 [Mucidula mucida]KAF8912479.1 hypothetical protein CPB85DRAFT_1220096 [Mucidula mucida]
MNFTSFILFYVAAFVSIVAAAPMHLTRDVFVPPVLTPDAATSWTVNSTVTVTWDVSSPPAQITNKLGSIRLRKADRALPLVLADGFDILLGEIEVTVPWVVAGTDYSIVLFGDSGNWSQNFSIVGGPEF